MERPPTSNHETASNRHTAPNREAASNRTATSNSTAMPDDAASPASASHGAANVTGGFPVAIDGSTFGWTAGLDETMRILTGFADAGGRLVCTADHYAGGRSEVMIGRWLSTLRDRSQAIVATKIGRHPDSTGLSARSIVRATEASLYRLATDYIDILSFDGEHPETPIDESLEAVDALRRAGKVRYLAASGYRAERIAEVADFAAAAAYPVFRAVIAEYNLLCAAQFETELAPVLRRLGIDAITRFPLAGGLLGDDERPGEPPHDYRTRGADRPSRRAASVRRALRRVADERGLRMRQVALAWVLCHPGVASVMVQARDVDELDGLLEAVPVRLTRHDLSALNKVAA